MICKKANGWDHEWVWFGRDKIITWKGQLGEHKIQITQSNQFSTCTEEELANNPIGTDFTRVMPNDFDIKKVPAIILKGEVIKEDQLPLWQEINHTKAFSSTEALLDDLLMKEAEAMYPEAKIVGYSTRTCNHYQRQHCYILTKK